MKTDQSSSSTARRSWQTANPQFLHTNVKQGQSCRGALWGGEPIAWPQQVDPFTFQSAPCNTSLFLHRVSESHNSNTGLLIARWVCAWPCNRPSLILVVWKVHVWSHNTLCPPGKQYAATPQNTSHTVLIKSCHKIKQACHTIQPAHSLLAQG